MNNENKATSPERNDPWIFDGTQATARERAKMLRTVARAPRDDDSTTIERGADLIDALLDVIENAPHQFDCSTQTHAGGCDCWKADAL